MSNEVHRCPVCEYIHEDHDQTPWEDLPESWLCPACSVEKGWFETINK